MYEVGRVCIKTAGRDAGMKCVITEVLKDGKVMVEGETRKRAVNIKHLEPTKEKADVKSLGKTGVQQSSGNENAVNMHVEVRKTKPKKASPKPKGRVPVKKA